MTRSGPITARSRAFWRSRLSIAEVVHPPVLVQIRMTTPSVVTPCEITGVPSEQGLDTVTCSATTVTLPEVSVARVCRVWAPLDRWPVTQGQAQLAFT